uniref:Lipoprotein n=1 Tax=uncultured Thiotrichaceae bacterium TaxID=298394 RepID=A0A6S6UPA8_9GAMM|nr:MAG: Unknown protein [uncultured Thiotrichaceae bacterium]
MIKTSMILASVALVISGCVNPTPKDSPVVEPITSERCLVTNPTDVFMTIAGIPGSTTNSKSLVVQFVVTAPTPGYRFALKVKEIKESLPQQVILDLMVARPSGIVPQVITKTKVNTMTSGSSIPAGSSVQVNCGGKPFFKVDKLMAG